MKPHIDIYGLDPITQKFLFACAYRIVLADKRLVPEEHEWMKDAFGDARYNGWLQDFASMSEREFMETFDILSGTMPYEDTRVVFPQLHDWIVDCCFADNKLVPPEKRVGRDITTRVRLDAMLGRPARRKVSYPWSYRGLQRLQQGPVLRPA